MIGRIQLMMRGWRTTAIFVALSVWFVLLIVPLAEQQSALRLADTPAVTATVRSVWRQYPNAPPRFARLVFDRKRPDGQTVHCDVPSVDVSRSGRKLSPGDTLRVVPTLNQCWEPEMFCETCAPMPPRVIATMYAISALSGLLFVLLVWRAIRDLQRNGMANARLPDLARH